MDQEKKFKVLAHSPVLSAQKENDFIIFFHAVNKSGSGAFHHALYKSFFENSMLNCYVSPYAKFPQDQDLFFDITSFSRPPLFAISHYFYGKIRCANAKWISMVRNPLPRFMSVYGWLRKKSEAQGRQYISLEEFFSKGNWKNHSQISQFAFGYSDSVTKNERAQMTQKEMFDLALHNAVSDFSFIGVSDKLEETLIVASTMMGFEYVYPWQKDTRNLDRPKLSEIDRSLINHIKEVCHFEFEFFRLISARFDALLSETVFEGQYHEYKLACSSQYKERYAT